MTTAARERIAKTGTWGTVVWARAANGTYPAEEFYLGLDEEDKAKVLVLLGAMAERGRISNTRKFRFLSGAKCRLSEMKAGQVRLFGSFRPGRRYVVAAGAIKKKRKLKPAVFNSACFILADHDLVALKEADHATN